MDELFADLARVCAAVDPGRDDLRLIGGLAVRAYVGEDARITRDIDVVAMHDEARRALIDSLSAEGYTIGSMGPWLRASPADGSRRFVDIIGHPVVDARTFDAVTLRGSSERFVLGGTTVHVAAVTDLALLKLMACRDQDLIDLLLLASRRPVRAADIAQSAALDDIERRVASGAMRARTELDSGGLVAIAQQGLGRSPGDDEIDALRQLLAALGKEGL